MPEALWVEIAGEPFELELALDAASRHQGLSGRRAIEPNGGMLFVNTVESPRAMVMRDCAIPIDVAFLDFSGEVVAIHEMRPELPHVGPTESPKRVRIAVAGVPRAAPPRGSRSRLLEAGWTKSAFGWAIAWPSTSRARWISPAALGVSSAEARARRAPGGLRFGSRRPKGDAPAGRPRGSQVGLKPNSFIVFALLSPRRLRYRCPLLDPGDGRGAAKWWSHPANSTRSIEVSMSDVSLASPGRVRQTLNVGEILNEIGPDFESSRIIYWSDLLASAFVGWLAFVISARATFRFAAARDCQLGRRSSRYCALRSSSTNSAHLKRGQIPGFELVWNLIVGIPFMIPSLMYVGSHMDHHKRMGFGTNDDPEYAQIARWSRLRIVTFVFMVALLPLALAAAMGCTRPALSALPAASAVRGRQTLDARDQCRLRPPDAQGRPASNAGMPRKRAQPCSYGRWSARVIAGWIPIEVDRSVVHHRRRRALRESGADAPRARLRERGRADGRRGSAPRLRSIYAAGRFVTTLIAPVGLRFHALHHYLPFIPYHSLGLVHRRLLAELPQNAPYRATLRDGVGTLRGLWRNAAAPPRASFSVGRAAREL